MTAFTAALALLGLVVVVLVGVYAGGLLLAVAREPLSSPPFSGGLPPLEHAVSRYHVRWYTISMVFLAFDMEMVFMYPWTRVISATGPSSVVEMFTFLGVLLSGVGYAWREGAFRWT